MTHDSPMEALNLRLRPARKMLAPAPTVTLDDLVFNPEEEDRDDGGALLDRCADCSQSPSEVDLHEIEGG